MLYPNSRYADLLEIILYQTVVWMEFMSTYQSIDWKVGKSFFGEKIFCLQTQESRQKKKADSEQDVVLKLGTNTLHVGNFCFELSMSSKFGRTENTFESLQTDDIATGAGTNKQQDPWFLADLGSSKMVSMLEFGAFDTTDKGLWNRSHGLLFEVRCGENLGSMSLATVVTDLPCQVKLNRPVQYVQLQKRTPRGWFGLATFRIRGDEVVFHVSEKQDDSQDWVVV